MRSASKDYQISLLDFDWLGCYVRDNTLCYTTPEGPKKIIRVDFQLNSIFQSLVLRIILPVVLIATAFEAHRANMSPLQCTMCNTSDAKRCGVCHSASYCSQACQKADWLLHKIICKSFTALPERPSPSHKLAFLLPTASKTPEIIWVKCEQRTEDEGYGSIQWERSDIDGILSSEQVLPEYKGGIPEHKLIKRNALRGFNLHYTVQVICRDTFLIDGSKSNSCVMEITKGKMTHDWRGPIVVMRQPGTEIDPRFYEDVTAAELGIVVDYFLSYGRKF